MPLDLLWRVATYFEAGRIDTLCLAIDHKCDAIPALYTQGSETLLALSCRLIYQLNFG